MGELGLQTLEPAPVVEGEGKGGAEEDEGGEAGEEAGQPPRLRGRPALYRGPVPVLPPHHQAAVGAVETRLTDAAQGWMAEVVVVLTAAGLVAVLSKVALWTEVAASVSCRKQTYCTSF